MVSSKEQIEICKKYSSKIIDLDENEMVAIALETIGQLPIRGVRTSKREGDNISWFFYCGEFHASPDFFKPMHASHLNEYLPEVLKFLCLEPGYKFMTDQYGFEDVWKED
ncbi:hypothetical protein AAFM71_11950 [Chromobacterium violaceum]|uniref:immunity protein Imm33 domain-containing protein n=1 Tax=Chromobacterium violaceum TaxID=536 RepID=UPI003859FE65